LDIENEAEAVGSGATSYEFHFDIGTPTVSWEVPGGFEESEAPVARLDHLRWLRVSHQRGAVLLRGRDAPAASIDANGTVMSHAARGVARYRLGLHSEYDSPDLPWQFGWGTTPMLTARVVPRADGLLPTFGAIFNVERVGVAVLGISPINGRDAILYLQELLGVGREVSVSAGLARFSLAQPVDLMERPTGEPLVPQDGSVSVPIAGRGITAVRLSGLELI
jgi:hypothetical protein